MELWEKTVESDTLFEGKIVTLKLDKAELPNGRVARREVVEHPGGVAILPLFDDGTVSIVRQFRYPFQEVVTELPAGKLEKGEDHRPAALRELEEEVGVPGADPGRLPPGRRRVSGRGAGPLLPAGGPGDVRRDYGRQNGGPGAEGQAAAGSVRTGGYHEQAYFDCGG